MMSPHRKQHSHTPQDRSVDTILAALNRTEAPATLEERVLQRIAQQQEPSARVRWDAFLTKAHQWHFATVFAAAVLLAAALLITPHLAPRESQTHGTPLALRQSTPQLARSLSTVAPYTQSSSEVPRSGPENLPFDRRPRSCGRSEEVPVCRSGDRNTQEATTVAAAVAADAADGPAPELPLTEQERLLIRIAQGPRKPQQLASLKRFTVHLRPDDDTPDFQTFFEPYTTPLTQGDPQ